MKLRRDERQHTLRDEESIWGFGRIIRYMSEKVGSLGGWGPRNTF